METKEKLQNYPICDADIWIKMCKLDKHSEFFKTYKKLIFSDAVHIELKNKAKDKPSDLACGLNLYKVNKDNIHQLDLKSDYFTDIQRRMVYRAFSEHQIDYNNGTFTRDKHVGEKVSLIYAGIHNLKIFLSDDNGAKTYAQEKFKSVDIIDFIEFAKSIGIREEHAKIYREIASNPFDKQKADQEIARGALKTLEYSKYYLLQKQGV